MNLPELSVLTWIHVIYSSACINSNFHKKEFVMELRMNYYLSSQNS